MTSKVFINGKICNAENASVSVLDRGYLFSDGVYELIPYFNKKPFLFDKHYLRLEKSLKSIALKNPYEKKIWVKKINSFVKECEYKNFSLYIQVTRGVPNNIDDGILREHATTKEYKFTICMFCSEIKELSNNYYMGTRWNENQPEDHERYARNDLTGMVREDLALEFPAMQNAITAEDKRWLQCDIKSIALLFNAYTKSIAYKKGAYEAILSRDNVVTEGCSSNVFIIKDKIIKTPPKSNLILPGITRDFIINDILQRKQYEILETKFSKKELLAADEVFITNSTQGVLSIVKIDNQIVNNEECGEITTQIYRNFIDYIR